MVAYGECRPLYRPQRQTLYGNHQKYMGAACWRYSLHSRDEKSGGAHCFPPTDIRLLGALFPRLRKRLFVRYNKTKIITFEQSPEKVDLTSIDSACKPDYLPVQYMGDT